MSFQIESERLIIRDVREADIPILVEYFAEPIARKNILSCQLDSEFNRKYFENGIAWAKHPQRIYYQFAVTLKTDDTLIGNCSIYKVYPESIDTNIGWHYGSRFRGNGYATEAAQKLLYFGFELEEVSSIYADCFVENKASIRIMEKIGMKPHWNSSAFNFMRGLLSYGEFTSAVRYSITRNQWLDKTNFVFQQ